MIAADTNVLVRLLVADDPRQSPPLRAWRVEAHRYVLCEERKIVVRGEDRKLCALGDRADEEVSVGTLDPASPALIEELRGTFEIAARDFEIGEGSQHLAKSPKLRLSTDPGKHFLPHRSDDLSPPFENEFA